MHIRFALALLLGLTGSAAAQQTPGPVGSPVGPWRAQIHWLPLDFAGHRYLLQSRVCRPSGEAPARVVVLAHGSPAVASDRTKTVPVSCDSEAARWFLERGFVVISAVRRGYGETGGNFAETSGSCDLPDYVGAGRETARDLAATVEYAATLPFAQPQGIVVVGQSAGGWGTVAYNSTPHPRVTALVSMAGGRGGHRNNEPDNNCNPGRLAEAAGTLAHGATTPMLWVFTDNDSFFAPAVSEAMYAAYKSNGGAAEFRRLGAFGSDGHRLFFGAGGSRIWGPLIERYLAARPSR